MNTHRILKAFLILTSLLAVAFAPLPVQAAGQTGALPAPAAIAVQSFDEFVAAVQNGQTGVVRGVYVPGVLALPVIQQPGNNAAFVSRAQSAVTQFRMAAQYGTIGLLAHNYLSGASFGNLAAGHEVRIVYGDSSVRYFMVTKVLRYVALNPTSPKSDFKDLDSGVTLTAAKLFVQAYQGNHVTFQTCIAKDKNLSWGRLFVIAVPVADTQLQNALAENASVADY